MNITTLHESANKVRKFIPNAQPSCALILGSGWGEVSSAFKIKKSINYIDIPCIGATKIKGHSGKLILADFANIEIIIFQGRRHWYEGSGWEPVAFPVYLCVELGVDTIILTNSAGGIRKDLKPGDIMIIDDHINAIGSNPLKGNHNSIWGPRFPDQTFVYDKYLRTLLDETSNDAKLELQHGVYIATSGPLYETPAEIAMFRTIGADAVGMSTVPEAILAHSAGIHVAGISCIANLASGISPEPLSHEEVLNQTKKIQPLMKLLITGVIKKIADNHVLSNKI